MSDGRIRLSLLRQVGRSLVSQHWTQDDVAQRIETQIFQAMEAEAHGAITGEDPIVGRAEEAHYRHLLSLVLDKALQEPPWIHGAAADADVVPAFLEMDPFLRNPDKWAQLEQEEERTREILEHAKDLLAFSTAYTCRNRRCKSKRFRVDSQQIRSADEAMTTIIRCLECGIGWTEN